MSNQTISEAARKAADDLIRTSAHWIHINAKIPTSDFPDVRAFLEHKFQSAIDAAARVEPTDKDEELDKMHDELHKMILSSVFGWPDGENSKAHQLLYKIKRHSHNASLPATPTPQGRTSEETGAPFSLIDLLQGVGLENVQLQPLAPSLAESHTNKKGETKISFWTRAVTTNDLLYEGKNRIGFILWIKKVSFDSMLRLRGSLISSVESTPSPTERETKSSASLGAATDKEERFS